MPKSSSLENSLDQVHINFDTASLHTLNIALALVMFGIALEIKWSDFVRVIKRPQWVFLGIFSQFVCLPALTFLLVLLLKPSPGLALGMILVAACPGGNVSNFMTHLSGGNAALSVTLTAMATLLAIVMTPFNLRFWGSLYGPTNEILQAVAIDPLAMGELVALLLGIPLLLGMLCNRFLPVLSYRLAPLFKIGSLLFFAVLVVLALGKNWAVFLDYVHFVLLLVLAHNALAFGNGFVLAKLADLDLPETKTITLETGIQNSGLGLMLIFLFFDGLGSMALITAFWGIWHLVSGTGLAFLWSRLPKTSNALMQE